MALLCYVCGKHCKNVDDYSAHLRNMHSLIEPCTLQCNIQGCRRTFTTYKSLRRHMRQGHCDSSSACSDRCEVGEHAADIVFNNNESFDISQDNEEMDCCSTVPCIDDSGVSQAALKFVTALASSSSVPMSTVDFVRNSTAELVRDILSYLKGRVVSVLSGVSKQLLFEPAVKQLVDDFCGWMDPFKGIESEAKLLTYLKKKELYIPPEPHSLGKRWDVRRDKVTNKQVQVQVDDNFYYVPIEKTLKLILRHEQSWHLLDRWAEKYAPVQSVNSNDGIIGDWMDSSNGQKLRTYCNVKFPDSLPIFIQVYFDDVETVNPLGSKTGIHKLGAFYFTVRNFPALVNSSLHNIHLLALAHTEDVKQHGMDAVLKVLVEELKFLHDVGFVCSLNGEQRTFRCFLTQVVGDNLGLHSVLGYVENFNRATYACDLCLSTQSDMQQIFHENKLTLRTPELYEQQTADLASGKITSTACGIKRPSVLCELPYYHPAVNDATDIMHDLFEGVIPYETKLFLNHLLYEVRPTCMTINELNRRIKMADYGQCNSRSKPSTVTESNIKSCDSNLGQRSAQMTTLFHYLPLLLSDVIILADPQKLQLLNVLKQIVNIVMSPLLSDSMAAQLAVLVADHHGLFKHCYPDNRVIYKQHRMVHYGSLVRRSGPLMRMNVIRYEAKHNFFKRFAHVVCNFKNISLSVSSRHQMAQAFRWMCTPPLKGCLEVGNGYMAPVEELVDSDLLIPHVGYGVDIFVVKKLSMFGQEYYTDMTVLVDISEEGEPTLALVNNIYVHANNVYFAATFWLLHGFCSSTRSYNCTLDNQRHCIKSDDLFDYKPLSAVQCTVGSCVYKHIVLRHLLCSDKIYSS